jgi:hypothetical protein
MLKPESAQKSVPPLASDLGEAGFYHLLQQNLRQRLVHGECIVPFDTR